MTKVCKTLQGTGLRTIISMVTAVVLLFTSVVLGFGNLKAEAADVTIIYTQEQLAAIANNLSGYYELGCDINLSGAWTPIGILTIGEHNAFEGGFRGSFNGRGHKITGLYVNSDYIAVGLFGFAKYATIQNVGVFGSVRNYNGTKFTDPVYGGTFRGYAGGLAGYSEGSVFKNCYSGVSVSIPSGLYTYLGGLLGGTYVGSVVNCCATGTVTDESASGNAIGVSGGLIGANSASLVSNCYAAGVVKFPTQGSASCTGGLIGRSYSNQVDQQGLLLRAKIDSCYSLTGSDIPMVGMSLYSNVTNCEALTSDAMKDPSFANRLNSGIGSNSTLMKWTADTNGVNNGYPAFTTITAPTGLVWKSKNSGIAKWDAVTGSNGYTVKLYKSGTAEALDAESVAAGTTEYDFTDKITSTGDYTFTVITKGDGTTALDSAESSASAAYSNIGPLPAPTVAWDATIPGKATWSAVAGTTGYSISLFVSGTSGSVTTKNVAAGTTEYDFTSDIGYGDYTFSVVARGDFITSAPSEAALSATYSHPDTRTPMFAPSSAAWDTTIPGKATWSAVVTAPNGYTVRLYKSGKGSALDTEIVSAGTTEYDFTSKITLTGSYTFSVSVNGNSTTTVNSTATASGAYSYTDTRTPMPAPLSLAWDAAILGRATWSEVTDSSGYIVMLYTVGISSAVDTESVAPGTTEYDFKSKMTSGGSYTFKVIAKGDGTIMSDSAESARSAVYVYKPPTLTPTSLTWDASAPGKAKWTKVSFSNGYIIKLYKSGTAEAVDTAIIDAGATAAYDFSSKITSTGNYTFTVTAKGNGTTTSDSAESAPSAVYTYTTQTSSLSVPLNLAWNSTIPGKATWDAVTGANGYTVKLYKFGTADAVDTESTATGIAVCDFTSKITSIGSYTFTVTADGDGTIYTDSAESSPSAAYSCMVPVQSMTVGNSASFNASDIANSNTLTITAIVTGPNSAYATASLNSGTVTVSGLSKGSTSMVVTVSDGKDAVVDVTVPIEVTVVTDVEISISQSPIKSVLNAITFGLFFDDTIDVSIDSSDSTVLSYEYQKVTDGDTFDENGTWTTGSSFSIHPDYKGKVYTRAVYNGGHTSEYTIKALVVDETKPEIDTDYDSSSASIDVTVTDISAGIETITYHVGTGNEQTINLEPTENRDIATEHEFTISDLPDGKYDVVINATDNSGNKADTKTIGVDQTVITDATISPKSVSYDLSNPDDVSTSIGWNSAGSVTDVVYNTKSLKTVGAYAISENTLTIKSDYLDTLDLTEGDTAKFKISFDVGNPVTFTVNAVDNYTPSDNADLKSLTVNGNKVSGFTPDDTEYDVELPYGTASVLVGAAADDTNSSVVIIQANSLPGNAAVEVTAEDKTTTKTYTIDFTLGAKLDVPVTSIIVTGTGGVTSLEVDETLQMLAAVLPNNASQKDVDWSTESGSGAYISTDGLLTATATGKVTVRATAQDGSGVYGEKKITIKNTAPPSTAPTITTKSLDDGVVGKYYDRSLTAIGDAPIIWSIESGDLPEGLTLSSDGDITGAPKTNGTFNFTVKAKNNKGDDTKALNITINLVSDGSSSGSGGSDSSTTTSSASTHEPTSDPKIGETAGWTNIDETIKNAKTDDTLDIDMNGTTEVPKSILSDIKGKDITLVLDFGTYSWTINGNDVTFATSIDLGIEYGTRNIDTYLIDNLTGEHSSIQLSLNYNGGFGFTGTLMVKLPTENSGSFANLFYHNPETNELEFQTSGIIDTNGNAQLKFTHASDYVIVIDNVSMEKNISAGAGIEDNSKPITAENDLSYAVVVAVMAVVMIVLKQKKARK